jgi:hypothetical protein
MSVANPIITVVDIPIEEPKRETPLSPTVAPSEPVELPK